jgi:hypothetical protein
MIGWGPACIVQDYRSKTTYCLCLGFYGPAQELFHTCILQDPHRLRDPRSILIVRYDLTISRFKSSAWSSAWNIGRLSTALSTGNYLNLPAEASLQQNLNDVTRALTKEADVCTGLKYALIGILRLLEEFRKSAGAFAEAPDATNAVDLGIAERFYDEDLLNYMITATQSALELCQRNMEAIQAHIQTVSKMIRG